MRSTSSRRALAALSLSMLLASLGTSSASMALPTLARAFAAPFHQVQWVVIAYLLASTALVVFVGRWGDQIGKWRLLSAGLSLFLATSLLCGLSPSLWLLVLGRAGQGVAAAVMLALTMALVGETVPKAKAERAMGLVGAMSAAGTALGPSLGGVLLSSVGWRGIFLIHVPASALALLLARSRPRESPVARRATDPAPPGLWSLLSSSLWLAHSSLRGSLLASALVASVMMALMVVGPYHLSQGLSLPAWWVGLLLSIGPGLVALTGVPAGRIVDRWGASRTATIGLAGMGVGCALLAVLPATLGVAGYIVPVALTTLSYGVFQVANNTAVMANVSTDQRGVVSGLLNLSRSVGLMAGASLMAGVFAKAAAADLAQASPEQIARGLRVTFIVAASLIGLALLIVSSLRVPPADSGERLARA